MSQITAEDANIVVDVLQLEPFRAAQLLTHSTWVRLSVAFTAAMLVR